MSYRYAPRPDDLALHAKWRKDKALTWFHQVTSQMSEAEIVQECLKRGVSMQGKTIHELQTELLRFDGEEN